MAPPRRPEIVIGLDVGKSSHWACVATRDGEILASNPVANRENALDSLFGRFPGALVVVDQVAQHRRARARPRAGGGNAVGVPAGPGRPRGRQAVRRRRQDRRARRDGHREDRARHPRRAAAGPPSRPRDRRGEGARGAKGLPDPREHQEQKQAAQHPAGIVPRVRIAGRPVRRLRTAAHGRPRRAVVGGRRRAPKGGGARPRRAARQGGRARRVRGVV